MQRAKFLRSRRPALPHNPFSCNRKQKKVPLSSRQKQQANYRPQKQNAQKKPTKIAHPTHPSCFAFGFSQAFRVAYLCFPPLSSPFFPLCRYRMLSLCSLLASLLSNENLVEQLRTQLLGGHRGLGRRESGGAAFFVLFNVFLKSMNQHELRLFNPKLGRKV